jgi:hypothetical protein
MSKVVLDAATLAKLCGGGQVQVYDEAGHVVGQFQPIPESARDPKISEEELERRYRAGGGRPLADILADLERQA